ncbi:hypothetical protein F4821DRAFT_242177 [Hypoxylon rubiginosum]|uniref:Uncharacterized protein n=1 Tax=Hypoxylon rubiginosum TaxID=110542 RepID=A0ACC0CWL3_9PEZI|nr:hypothetical protein F4821DRAFT_242177 [Hypoxylon rubiginosum]
MDKSLRSTSPHSTSDPSYAPVVDSPVHDETGGDMHSTSSVRAGKFAPSLKTNQNGHNRDDQRDRKSRHATPRTTVQSTPKADGKDDLNHVHGGQFPPSATSFRDQLMQRAQGPGLPPVKTGIVKDAQTVADYNTQVASMQARIEMLEDDLSRRTSELIEAKTALARKNDENIHLRSSIDTMQGEFADLIEEDRYKYDSIMFDLRRDNDNLRDAIRTGIISIADIYGSNASEAFTHLAEDATDRAASGRSSPEPSPASSGESSSEHSPAARASVSSSSSSTLQPHSPAGDDSSQQQTQSVHSGQPSEASDELKVAGDTREPLEVTTPIEVVPQVHEEKEAEKIQEDQPSKDSDHSQESEPSEKCEPSEESQPPQESQHSAKSREIQESQPAEDSARQHSVHDKGPSTDVKSITADTPAVTPTVTPCTPVVSMKNKEAHDSPVSPTPPPAHPATNSPTTRTGSPATPLSANQPRSWANVASSPPKDVPVAPREKNDGKNVSPPQVLSSLKVGNGAPKTLKFVSPPPRAAMKENMEALNSNETASSQWRDRAVVDVVEPTGARREVASSKASDQPTPSTSKAKPNSIPVTADARGASPNSQVTNGATGKSEAQPEEQADGWKSVKSKYKPKNKNWKSKGANQAQGMNQATTGTNGKPTPKESGNAQMSTNTMPKAHHTLPHTQQKWKRQNGTVIGSRSIFSQPANKQKENQSSPTTQEPSGLRNVLNGGTSGQRSSSNVQYKPVPKKSTGNRTDSMGSAKSTFNWADDVEWEHSQKNPNDPVHSSF